MSDDIKISKHCVANVDDRCTQCRCRNISTRKKRAVCPIYRTLKSKDPVELYEYFLNKERRLTEGLQAIVNSI